MERKDILTPDYHIHTSLCKHAEGKPGDFRRAAMKQDIPEICFTDHAPAPGGYDPSHRMALHEFNGYHETIEALSNGQCPRVLFGIEADYYAGCRDFLDEWLPSQPFDFVLGSVHYIENWGFDNPEERAVWDSVDIAGTWKSYFQLVRELVRTNLFDAVAHLDLPKKFGYRPSDRDMKEMAEPVLDCIAGTGMAIEINTSGLRRHVKEIYPSPMLLELARERDIPICFGSDAHSPEEVGCDFDKAIQLAEQAGYTHAVRFRKRDKTPYAL